MRPCRRLLRAHLGSAAPTPTPSPTPTPTPSAATHNGTTPADVAYTVTNKGELDAAINAFVAGTGPNVIALRGPLAGSTSEAYTQGTGSYIAPAVTLPAQLEIRSAKFGDKAEFNLLSSSNLSARRCFQPINNSLWNGLKWNISFEPADFQIVLYGAYDNVKIRNIYARTTNPRVKSPNCRLIDLRGGNGNALEYSIVAGLACGISLTDPINTTIQNNSFLCFGEHAIKGVRGHTGTLIQRNWGDNPNPGYSGAYLDHANLIYIGGAFTDIVDNCQIIDNTMLSYVDQAHARMIGVAWNDGNGVDGSAPDPLNMKNLLLDNNRSFGGLVNTIGLYACGGVNNRVRNTHFYRILELIESSNALALTLDSTTLAQYDSNIATQQIQNGGSIPAGTGNAVSDSITTILAARAAAEAVAAGYGLQTSATLGI